MLRVDARNLERLGQAFGERAARELPFATALALTRTAKQAQKRVRRQLPKRFMVRRPHTARGIRVEAARKTTLTATVGSIDWYMEDQETGGVRRPRGRHIGQPTKAVRPRPSARIGKAKRPRALRQKPGVFVRKLGRGKRGLFIAHGRARLLTSGPRAGQKARPVRLAYVLVRRQRIRPRWDFKDDVAQLARRAFPVAFAGAVERMLRRALVPPAQSQG